MSRRYSWIFGILLALGLTAALVWRTDPGKAAVEYAWTRVRGGYTVPDRLDMHGGDVQLHAAVLLLVVHDEQEFHVGGVGRVLLPWGHERGRQSDRIRRSRCSCRLLITLRSGVCPLGVRGTVPGVRY